MMRKDTLYYRKGPQTWWKDTKLQNVMDDYFYRTENKYVDASDPFQGSKEVRTIYRMLHEQGKVLDSVDSLQCLPILVSFLCGYDCVRVFAGLDQETGKNYQKSAAIQLTDDQQLDRALKNLEKVDAVVVLEKLDDMIDQVRLHVDWIPDRFHTFPRDNPRRGKCRGNI